MSTTVDIYGIAVYMSMHTVIETPDYLQDAKDAGLSEDEMAAIIKVIASDPKAGDVMVGTAGARKVRFAASGKGKRGGVRTAHYFGGDDVPVFMLAVLKKGDRDNLSKVQHIEEGTSGNRGCLQNVGQSQSCKTTSEIMMWMMTDE